MTQSEFEELLQNELDKLPFEKGLDDGQYNDGQLSGFELGARWLLSVMIKPDICDNCNQEIIVEKYCPYCN